MNETTKMTREMKPITDTVGTCGDCKNYRTEGCPRGTEMRDGRLNAVPGCFEGREAKLQDDINN